MSRPDSGRDLVARLFETRYGLPVERISEGKGRTADLLLRVDGVDRFVCEVKTLGPPHLEWRRAEGGWLEHSGPDRGPQRVGRVIQEAADQLGGYACPRILAIVNRCGLDDLDLQAAFSGLLPVRAAGYPEWVRHMQAVPVAFGRLLTKKLLIDLYLWIDARGGGDDVASAAIPPVIFRAMTPVGMRVAQEHFRAPREGWVGLPVALPDPDTTPPSCPPDPRPGPMQ